jgi:puromycin-sensitive aminopeptidase
VPKSNRHHLPIMKWLVPGSAAILANTSKLSFRHRVIRVGTRMLCIGACLLFIGTCLLPGAAALSPDSQTKPSPDGTNMDGAPKAIVRLSKDVMPLNYDLTVEPNMKKFTFSGSEEITLSVAKPVREIVLNAADLDVLQAQIVPDGKTKQDTTNNGPLHATTVNSNQGQKTSIKVKIVPDSKTERLRLVLSSVLPAGTYRLSCKFNGTLNDKLCGFYRSSFEDDKQIKHWLCATQMEPIDARRMFPCFDEPEFKATYHLQTVIDPAYTAISNSPIEKEAAQKGKKIVSFEVTPKMSSYLVALVIGDFKQTGEKLVDGIPIRVWAVTGKEHLGQYALDEATKILAFERKYFGIAYPNKKLDLIAVPDFEAGGMENLGAITFSESELLTDDKAGSISSKKEITSVVAHEIAHQWFGDLVTMRWWDALWLNESFATWMATKTSDALHPEWRVMTEAVESRGGMSTDALRTTRAMHANVTTAGQVTEMFDNITYDKGESVLRMLEAFVGTQAFQDGVHKYLSAHAFSNATTEDLWNAIASCAPGVPVAQIMKTFIYQPGVPLVYVDLKDDGQSLLASQTRFFSLGDDKSDKSQWLIPMVLRQLSQSQRQGKEDAEVSTDAKKLGAGGGRHEDTDHTARLLAKKQATIPLGAHWPAVVVNASGMGYYHTCYSAPLLKNLENGFKNLTTEEKLIVTSDVRALTLSGRVPIEESYNFALNLPTESDPLVLADLISYLSGPHIYMTGETRQPYEKLIRYMAGPLKAKLGWTQKSGESEAETHLRNAVLDLLGTYGQDKETIDEASELLDHYRKDHSSVGANIIDSVLTIVTYNGGIKEYNELLSLYKTAQNPEDRNRALFSLAGFRNKQLAQKTLAFAMSKDVRTQDGLDLLVSVAAKRETRSVGWPFIEGHWGQIIAKYPEDRLRSLPHAASNVDTRAQEAEVRSWFARHPIAHAKAAIARMEEGMNLQLVRHERYGERIKKWTLTQAAKLPQHSTSSAPM